MAFGIGTRGDVGYGDPQSWGGPDNGVDLAGHADLGPIKTGFGANLSVDGWVFLMMIGALALLWLFGGVIFKNVNL